MIVIQTRGAFPAGKGKRKVLYSVAVAEKLTRGGACVEAHAAFALPCQRTKFSKQSPKGGFLSTKVKCEVHLETRLSRVDCVYVSMSDEYLHQNLPVFA
jgi:hypothetical protein